MKFALIFSALMMAMLAGFGPVRPASGEEPAYVGAAKCKLCHMKQHKIWSASVHAKAFEALKPAEQKDPKCLACHVSGYRQTQQVPAGVSGVDCEACHGPGSLYLKIHPRKDKEGAKQAGLIAEPEPASCKNCHNPESPTFKGFDYDKMWEAIQHSK